MRAAFLSIVLATSLVSFVAMFIALWRHRRDAVADYVWSLIPWVIVALCALPSMRGLH